MPTDLLADSAFAACDWGCVDIVRDGVDEFAFLDLFLVIFNVYSQIFCCVKCLKC